MITYIYTNIRKQTESELNLLGYNKKTNIKRLKWKRFIYVAALIK